MEYPRRCRHQVLRTSPKISSALQNLPTVASASILRRDGNFRVAIISASQYQKVWLISQCMPTLSRSFLHPLQDGIFNNSISIAFADQLSTCSYLSGPAALIKRQVSQTGLVEVFNGSGSVFIVCAAIWATIYGPSPRPTPPQQDWKSKKPGYKLPP